MLHTDPSFYNAPVSWLTSYLYQEKFPAVIVLLLAEEAGIPLPLPGDMLIAFSGYEIVKGELSLLYAYVMLLLSICVGSSILYAISYRFGEPLVLKIGKYIHIDEHKLRRVEHWFQKYGPWVIIIGRHIPGFRTVITVFSGIAKVKYKTFILSTLVTSVVWVPIYLFIGMKLGKNIVHFLNGSPWHIFFAFSPLLIGVISFLYLRWKRK